MTSPKRALAALALGALALPIISTPALADGEDTPPPPRSVAAFCAGVQEAGFTDVADDNTFRDEINCIAEAEITRGLQGGSLYGPTLQVSRGQMASFIARMLDTADQLDRGDNVRALPAFNGTNRFTDVAADDVHRQAINRLAEAGIVQGGPAGLPATVYGSTLNVSRAQMASFVIRSLEFALNGELDTTADYFTDDANATPHQANINTVASLAIAIGDGNDLYIPAGSTSRGQMAAFIARSLAYLESQGLIRPLVVAPAAVSVTNQGSVTVGDAITGAITGAGVASATVSGPCVTAGNLTDTDATAGGIQFSIPTTEDAATGQCAVAFTVSFSDGRPSQTTTVNVTLVAAADETAPAFTSASPADEATDVDVDVTPTATFDEDVTAESTAVLTLATDDVALDADVSVSGGTITLTPAATLAAGTAYTVTFTARDAAGNASSPQVITFTTAAVVAPTVSVSNEGDVTAGEAITGAITGAGVASATVSGPCVTAGSLTDTDPAAAGIQFSIPTTEDAATGSCAVAFTVSFSDDRAPQTTTVDVPIVAADASAPAFTSATAQDQDILITYTEALDCETVEAADYAVTYDADGDGDVAGPVDVSPTGVACLDDTVTLTFPGSPFAEGSTGTVTKAADAVVTDLAGNDQAEGAVISYVAAAPTPTR